MFWPYDHLQEDIYTSEINTNDNGSVDLKEITQLQRKHIFQQNLPEAKLNTNLPS
jgi:hypothetical protein